MPDQPTFIIVEGLLSESGTFELTRGFEDTRAELSARVGQNNEAVTVALLNEEGATLSSVEPLVHFPAACDTLASAPGLGLIRAAVARQADARRVELRVSGRVVYSAEVARRQPRLRARLYRLTEETAQVAVRSGETRNVGVVARLTDGRRLVPAVQRDGNRYTVDLRSLEGLGTANLVVEATRGFRTTRVVTRSVTLPEPTINGRIIEPGTGAPWPYGRRGSLIGNLSDRNGRRIDWGAEKIQWLVNGDPVGGEQMVAWQPQSDGDHLVQMVHHRADGQTEVLAERTVDVAKQTEPQKEYEAVLAAWRHVGRR